MNITEVIERYLHGDVTEMDLKILRNYFRRQDLSFLKERMENDWQNDSDLNKELPIGLSTKMHVNIKEKLLRTQKVQLVNPRRNFAKIAAVAIILLIVGFGSTIWLSTRNEMKIYVTDQVKWKLINLPDGSVVELNANSEIKFHKNWKIGADRQVWLDGEAFFEVEKKAQTNAKFQVITKDLVVEVLGTSFNVNSSDEQTEVFLEEGKIKLDLANKEEIEILSPGDFIAYSAGKKEVIERKNKASAEFLTSWKEGVLEMEDKPIAEILKAIEEIYDIKVQVSGEKIKNEIKTVKVPKDELEIVLPILELTFKVKITREGNTLFIN